MTYSTGVFFAITTGATLGNMIFRFIDPLLDPYSNKSVKDDQNISLPINKL